MSGIAFPFYLARVLTSIESDSELPGKELLAFIAEHRSWWTWLQPLTMKPTVLLIIPLMARVGAVQVWR